VGTENLPFSAAGQRERRSVEPGGVGDPADQVRQRVVRRRPDITDERERGDQVGG
jgi:hypothetical protein